MSFPQHPQTIVIKNSFYPSGLTELDVWNYYQKNKQKILSEVDRRDLMFFIMIDVNKPIVVRAGKTSKFIRLNEENYDKLITGRTVSIHSTMKASEDFGVIDIDSDDFTKSKEATLDVYNFVTKEMLLPSSIRFTGKSSFHVFCYFPRKMYIDSIRSVLRKRLLFSKLSDKYIVSSSRVPGIPNLDLSPNKFRGGFITLHSLSTIGLRCLEVSPKKVMDFERDYAKIK